LGFPTKALDQDLILTPDSGPVIVTQDELGNTYGRVGGDYRPIRMHIAAFGA
jgi:hypothetical protein